MKLRITLILLALNVTLFAQSVVEEQRTLLTKKTATWCPLCGQWGWTMMKDLIEDNSERALILGAHYSGDLETQIAKDLTTHFGGAGQPKFYANNVNQGVSSGNLATKRAEIKTLVDNNFNMSPVVNAGVEAVVAGGKINIDVKTRFFQPASGEYYVAVFIVENDVLNKQSGQGTNALHPNVMRTSAVSTWYGEVFSTGNADTGDEATFSYSIDGNPAWKTENLRAIVTVWKKDGSTYEFVNGDQDEDLNLSTSVDDQVGSNSLRIVPSILKDISKINIELNSQAPVSLDVYNLLGEKMVDIYQGVLPAGTTSFDMHRDRLDRNGMYFLTLRVGDKTVSKRFLVK